MPDNPGTDFPILNPASPGYFAGAPYGDLMEVTGPPKFIFIEEKYTEFFRTDARSVLITVHPHHYNFIPNPAFRNGTSKWEVLGFDTYSVNPNDSWVGQSVVLTGTGTVRYRENATGYVYVGPVGEAYGEDWMQHGRSGPQWTFSAFFKGQGRVRLVMDAYSSQGTGPEAPPFGTGIRTVPDPSIEPYSAADPYLLDPEGRVWMLRVEPYYNDLGKPPILIDPATTTPVDRYVLDTQTPPHLWMADGAPMVYVDQGPTTEYALNYDPAVEEPPPDVTHIPPGDPYLRTTYYHVGGVEPDPRDGHVWGLKTEPYYYTVGGSVTIASIAGAWTDLNSTEWQRLLVQTQARYSDNPAWDFGGCRWIDARIEVENANGLLLSAVMLDPTEHPVAQYFDGGMVEDAERDDFLWGDEEQPDNCVSEYYYDRIARVQWMHQNIQYFVPVGRPYQIFFGQFSRPYEGSAARRQTTTRNLTR